MDLYIVRYDRKKGNEWIFITPGITKKDKYKQAINFPTSPSPSPSSQQTHPLQCANPTPFAFPPSR